MKVLQICVGFLLLILEVFSEKGKLNINQHDYQLKTEWFEVISYNKDYLKEARVTTFKYNRTCTAFNMTILFQINVGNKLEVILQAYKFASNEYRQFPLRFQYNLCEAIMLNTFGFYALGQCGNFTGCPLVKGRTYYICNFSPDASHFPPLIPTGRYMLEFQLLYFSHEVAVGRSYGEISRPFVK